MLGRAVLTLCAVASVAFVACGGDDDASADAPAATLATTATTQATTPTTLTVEQEVEAAYLRSWDVYADAMLTFDTSRLAEVYADEALDVRLDEVSDLKAANTPARMSVEHNVVAVRVTGDEAVLRDEYVNHSVLLNADGTPAEADPDEQLTYEYVLREREGMWKVALVTPL